MGLRISGNRLLENNLNKAQQEYENSIERLSTGIRFTRSEPMPVERARSDALISKMRELNIYKQNINAGLGMTQAMDSELSSMTNNVIRLKELTVQATNPNLSDKERSFLFVEYQANYEDLINSSINAHSLNTMNNLNIEPGNTSELLQVRVSAATNSGETDSGLIKIDSPNSLNIMPSDLGIQSAETLTSSEEGISIDDILDNFNANNESELSESFNSAQQKLLDYRSKIGASTARLSHALDSVDVAYENIAAANSRIRDVDYATEMTNLAKANILVKASTSLIAFRNNNMTENILNLIRSTEKNT